MIKHLMHLTVLIGFTCIMALYSCKRHNKILDTMDLAENLLESRPDSSLSILNSLDGKTLNKGKEAARFALLKSMALDKNYVDDTTFTILQPAIDYYLEKGSADEKLRTLYYQGRIYQNQGNDDSAMNSFMKACDLKHDVTDSLLLAHTLVAQATLYFKQYKIKEFIRNNVEAAELYGSTGKDILEVKSYTNALDGFIMQNDKRSADSLLSICVSLVQNHPGGEVYLFPSFLSYTIEFCSPYDIKTFLDKYKDLELTTNQAMNFAKGYSKIGEYDNALNFLSGINLGTSSLDSLKYASVKIDILEGQGKYEQAFNLYKNYSAMLEQHQNELMSKDLLFSDKKHQLEIENLMKIQKKDRIIWETLCCIFGLIILVVLFYYRNHLSKTKRILAEKENENLRLEKDNMRKEKKRLEAEQRQHELEAANLKLEISQLEDERNNLQELFRKQSELAKPIQDVINVRLHILNGLLAKEITQKECYAEPYNKLIEIIHNDKKEFMNSTRQAFTASHPRFMTYLEQHNVSIDEINYLCLYAIGLRGKEVGEYMQLKRHYIISHEIRKKLGIDEHETNIGIYIRKLMKDLE